MYVYLFIDTKKYKGDMAMAKWLTPQTLYSLGLSSRLIAIAKFLSKEALLYLCLSSLRYARRTGDKLLEEPWME